MSDPMRFGSAGLVLGLMAVFILAWTSSNVVAQWQPIPPTYDGYSINTPLAPIWLEAYYDFLCPDSAATWPVIQQGFDEVI